MVARDHFAQVAAALYSLPTRFIGKRLRARADSQLVRFYVRTLFRPRVSDFCEGRALTSALWAS
jgi:hypothetical protein